MAHRSTTHNRRMLATPEPHNQPTLQNPQTPDRKIPSSKPFYMFSQLKKPDPFHKIAKSPTPSCKDLNLQLKAMNLSADFDVSILKQHKTINPKLEKEIPKEKVNNKKKNGDKELRVSLSGAERRRSCGSEYQVDLSDFLSSNGAKVVSVDMPPFMQIHAIDCARKAHDSLEKFTSKSLAFTLKKEFDRVYGPAWHCIVGTGFGSFVTYSVGGFLYFSLDQKLYILLFKTAVQRAD